MTIHLNRSFSFFALLALLTIVSVADPGGGGIEITEGYVRVPHDTVPRFGNIADAGTPIIVNLGSGNFSDPAIWPNGLVPGTDARVQIASDTVVTYDLHRDTRVDCIEVEPRGHLTFASDRSTKLVLNELMIMPDGELTIGSVLQPIEADVTADIIFRGDTDLKAGTLAAPGIDPRQYGKGLLVFGKVTIHGRQQDETFVRFSREPLAGDAILLLESAPNGWQVGDRLIIPDTRQHQFTKNHTFISQAEEAVIASIDGNKITLESPLNHDHRGPRDLDGDVGPVERSMLPHVGNLTRNVVIRSEDADTILRRGHTIYFHRADVDIRYASFHDLGRTTIAELDSTSFDDGGTLTKIGTNQIGRYSIHLHHVWGPENLTNTGYQLRVVGNVIQGMQKWGMTVHDTHYGLIQRNIAYDGKGSAIATEDGNEAFNVFERNFVIHTKAGDTQQILSHSVGRGGVFNNRTLFGTTRDAFWFSGEHNYVRDNVAANVPDFAFNYNGYYISKTMRIPRFRGADMSHPDQYEGWNYHGRTAQYVEGRDYREGLPVLESARNEAYSSGQGLWLTWARGCCGVSYYKQESLFEDYRLWHINHTGVYAYHESRNTFRGFVLRNDPTVSLLSGPNARLNRGLFFGSSSYENGQLIVSDFDVQGFNIGLTLPPNPQDGTDEPNVTLIENGVLMNHVNIQESYPTLTDGKKTIIRNVFFVPTRTYQSNALPADPVNIVMSDQRSQQMHPMSLSQTFVEDFNGEPGNSFQIYWKEQAPDAVVPPAARPDLHAGDPEVTCPEEGLTNKGCLEQYGVVTAGAIAPCVELDGGGCEAAQLRAANLGIIGLAFPLMTDETSVTFASWQAQHFTGEEIRLSLIAALVTDADEDGASNLLEYALGTDPRVSDSNTMYVTETTPENTLLVLVIPKARADLQYTTEISTDLATWLSGSDHIEALNTIDNGDGTESHVFRVSVESDATFVRLRVAYLGSGG